MQDCLSSLHDVRAAGRPKLIVTRKFTQFNSNSLSNFSQNSLITHVVVISLLKRKVNTHIIKRTTERTKSTQRDRKKKNLFKHRREHMAAEAAKNTKRRGEEKEEEEQRKRRRRRMFGGRQKKMEDNSGDSRKPRKRRRRKRRMRRNNSNKNEIRNWKEVIPKVTTTARKALRRMTD